MFLVIKLINYPNGKKCNQNHVLSSASNRGMQLEDDINQTNNYYLACDIANIHKKPTPIQIVKVDYPARDKAKIIEAYFKVPSTTDYNGVYRGRAIDFEAKECASKTSFPLASIHPHQITHLTSVLKHGAIAFVIFRLTYIDKTYFVSADKVINFYENSKRKSIPYAWFEENGIIIEYNLLKPVDYLQIVDKLYF